MPKTCPWPPEQFWPLFSSVCRSICLGHAIYPATPGAPPQNTLPIPDRALNTCPGKGPLGLRCSLKVEVPVPLSPPPPTPHSQLSRTRDKDLVFLTLSTKQLATATGSLLQLSRSLSSWLGEKEWSSDPRPLAASTAAKTTCPFPNLLVSRYTVSPDIMPK